MQTCASGHTNGTQILSQRCPLSPFLFFRAGMMSALLDSNTQTNSIWLKLKGDFFLEDQSVLQRPRTGKAAWEQGQRALGVSGGLTLHLVLCLEPSDLLVLCVHLFYSSLCAWLSLLLHTCGQTGLRPELCTFMSPGGSLMSRAQISHFWA